MKKENINTSFLDGVLQGEYPDFYYHLGIDSNDSILNRIKDVKVIVVAGSGERITEFAEKWSKQRKDRKIYTFPKKERFVTCYCDKVLFVSHGMGMPSASICFQELMRLAYFLKAGDIKELDKIFWCRVGTSGGVGIEGGKIVVTTEGVMADLRPYRLLNGGMGEYWFDGWFPFDIAQDIIDANKKSGLDIVFGKTIAGNEFFLEQFRLDGAICLETPKTKMEWLKWIYGHGVRNIEMEGAMMAGFLNHWGFSKFAMICCSIVNRLNGDQITATKDDLHSYNENARLVLFNYLSKLHPLQT